MSKRARENDDESFPNKYARLMESSDDESSVDDGEDMIPEFLALKGQLLQKLTPLYPHFKKHLGPKLAVSLKDRLLDNLVPGPLKEMEKSFRQIAKLAEGLVVSWSAPPSQNLTEEEKKNLRGDAALEAWEKEIIEMEIKASKIYYPLELVRVKTSDSDSEEDEEEGSIPLAEISLQHLRNVPYVMASLNVSEFEKGLSSKLDVECDGLIMLNTHSTNIILQNWADAFEEITAHLANGKNSFAFALLFSLTNLMKSLDHWYGDFESPPAISRTMNTLQKLWNNVLSKTNEELGISGRESLREDLKKFLANFAQEVSSYTHDKDVKFTWKID
eukprot:TRINITY_DN9646_c0_g1_i1.p1 TRINITY_DN9646_c0_g1~~TRINITY_DN9646_c0_g1_i1.p1  ORF type:complete len:331 (-),score=65.23 TRINITY_DN9646_c0_g1_i1:24-1016(-)